MTPQELQTARQTIEAAGESCEDWLGVDRATIDAWSRGESPLPPARVRQFRWLLRFVERERAMAAEGIPECDWAEKQDPWLGRPMPEDLDEAQRLLAQNTKLLDEHANKCVVCQRRRAYWEEHPLPPFPEPGFSGWLVGLSIRVAGWLQSLFHKRRAA